MKNYNENEFSTAAELDQMDKLELQVEIAALSDHITATNNDKLTAYKCHKMALDNLESRAEDDQLEISILNNAVTFHESLNTRMADATMGILNEKLDALVKVKIDDYMAHTFEIGQHLTPNELFADMMENFDIDDYVDWSDVFTDHFDISDYADDIDTAVVDAINDCDDHNNLPEKVREVIQEMASGGEITVKLEVN